MMMIMMMLMMVLLMIYHHDTGAWTPNSTERARERVIERGGQARPGPRDHAGTRNGAPEPPILDPAPNDLR